MRTAGVILAIVAALVLQTTLGRFIARATVAVDFVLVVVVYVALASGPVTGLLAGPAANFVFAIVLLAAMLLVSGSTELRPMLGTVRADSPAARAGVRSGDEIVAVNNHSVGSQREVWLELLDGVTQSGPLTLRLRDLKGPARLAPI